MSRLVAAPHPFKTEHVTHVCPEGLTLAEMLDHAQCDPVLAAHAHIWVGDQHIPRDNWHRVRPKPGVTITLRVVPHGGGGGGGKNPLRTILTIAVIAAAFFVPPAWGVNLAGAFYGTGVVTAGQAAVGSALISGAIPAAGMLVLNA